MTKEKTASAPESAKPRKTAQGAKPSLASGKPAAEEQGQSAPQAKGKTAILVTLLERADGATIDAMMAATGWQAHSVRGAISGSIKKALGRAVISTKTEAGRTYRIEPKDA